jgi:hypothetical protein
MPALVVRLTTLGPVCCQRVGVHDARNPFHRCGMPLPFQAACRRLSQSLMGGDRVAYLALFPGKDNQRAVGKGRASGVGDVHGRRQARPEAGARHEWTLEVVACMPLLGRGYAPTSRCSLATAELHMTRRLTCTRQHACLCAVRWSPCLLCRATDNWFPMMLRATGSVWR